MVERFYGRKKRGENNECLRLVMKFSVKHITTNSVMMPSQRWLRKKACTLLFPWTWVATLILSQHLFVTWYFYTHLLLSKYVYEQLLLSCVCASFVLHCFLGQLHFFSNYSSCLLFICFSVPTQTLLHLYGNLTLLSVFPSEVQSRNICRNVCVHLSGMVFPWEV